MVELEPFIDGNTRILDNASDSSTEPNMQASTQAQQASQERAS